MHWKTKQHKVLGHITHSLQRDHSTIVSKPSQTCEYGYCEMITEYCEPGLTEKQKSKPLVAPPISSFGEERNEWGNLKIKKNRTPQFLYRYQKIWQLLVGYSGVFPSFNYFFLKKTRDYCIISDYLIIFTPNSFLSLVIWITTSSNPKPGWVLRGRSSQRGISPQQASPEFHLHLSLHHCFLSEEK